MLQGHYDDGEPHPGRLVPRLLSDEQETRRVDSWLAVASAGQETSLVPFSSSEQEK